MYLFSHVFSFFFSLFFFVFVFSLFYGFSVAFNGNFICISNLYLSAAICAAPPRPAPPRPGPAPLLANSFPVNYAAVYAHFLVDFHALLHNNLFKQKTAVAAAQSTSQPAAVEINLRRNLFEFNFQLELCMQIS